MTLPIIVDVHQAQPVAKDLPVANVTIDIRRPVPELPVGDVERYDNLYQQDATAIADALFASLPGGTLDRLIAIMLTRKASHFVVAWESVRRACKESGNG